MPDVSYTQQLPIATANPSVVVRPRTQSGPVPPSSSYIFGAQPTPGSTTSYHTTLQLRFVICILYNK